MRIRSGFVFLSTLLLVQCCCIAGVVSRLPPASAPLVPLADEGSRPQETLPVLSHTLITDTQVYTVRQTLRLKNDGSAAVEKLKLRVALIRDWEPYQDVRSMAISPSGYEILWDEYDNQYAEFWVYDIQPGESVPITLEFEVAVHGLLFDLSECTGPMIEGFTGAERYLETDAREIRSLAGKLSRNSATVCERQRKIYEHVIDTMTYTQVTEENGALHALQEGKGDCTDYADLMIALSRAAGMPASFVEGITYSTDGYFESDSIKHDWLEVYLPNAGWAPMDPTWGKNNPDQYFAGLSPDHIIVTKGRNLDMLNNYHYWSWWWWGDGEVTRVEMYDQGWELWKQ